MAFAHAQIVELTGYIAIIHELVALPSYGWASKERLRLNRYFSICGADQGP